VWWRGGRSVSVCHLAECGGGAAQFGGRASFRGQFTCSPQHKKSPRKTIATSTVLGGRVRVMTAPCYLPAYTTYIRSRMLQGVPAVLGVCVSDPQRDGALTVNVVTLLPIFMHLQILEISFCGKSTIAKEPATQSCTCMIA
jgi:hypothetical protein